MPGQTFTVQSGWFPWQLIGARGYFAQGTITCPKNTTMIWSGGYCDGDQFTAMYYSEFGAFGCIDAGGSGSGNGAYLFATCAM